MKLIFIYLIISSIIVFDGVFGRHFSNSRSSQIICGLLEACAHKAKNLYGGNASPLGLLSGHQDNCGAVWIKEPKRKSGMAVALTSISCLQDALKQADSQHKPLKLSYASQKKGSMELETKAISEDNMKSAKSVMVKSRFPGLNNEGFAVLAFPVERSTIYKYMKRTPLPKNNDTPSKKDVKGKSYGILYSSLTDLKADVTPENCGQDPALKEPGVICVTFETGWLDKEKDIAKVSMGTPFIVNGAVYAIAARKSTGKDSKGYIFMRVGNFLKDIEAAIEAAKEELIKAELSKQ